MTARDRPRSRAGHGATSTTSAPTRRSSSTTRSRRSPRTSASTPELEHTGGTRGWPGDSPLIHLDCATHPRARLGADAVDRARRSGAPSTGSSSNPWRPRRARGGMSVIFTPRAAAHQPRRRRHRPALVLPRARRLPGRRGDRQVRLHAHPHGLPAALPDEVLGVRGGRPTRRRSEHPILREALLRHWSGDPLEIASVADVPAGTGLGSSGAFTVCLLKALALARRMAITPGRWPRTPARSRSTSSASRSASRTSTSPPTAGSARTRSTRTARSTSSRSSCLAGRSTACATTSCSSTPARRARASAILADQVERTEAGDEDDAREPRPDEGDRAREPRAARAGDLEQLRRADARALGEQAQPLAGHGDRADRRTSTRSRAAAASSAASSSAPAAAASCSSTRDGRTTRAGDGAAQARRSSGSTSSSRAATASSTRDRGRERVAARRDRRLRADRAQARGRRSATTRSSAASTSIARAPNARSRRFGGARVRDARRAARDRARRGGRRRRRTTRSPSNACRALRRARTSWSRSRPGSASQTSTGSPTAAEAAGRLVKVGFNHRFHPAIARAVAEARSGRFGDVMHVRAPLRPRRPARLRARVARRPRAGPAAASSSTRACTCST